MYSILPEGSLVSNLAYVYRGVGDLVLVYKRISGLAGHTSRVSELLESVNRLSCGDPVETRRELYLRNLSSGNLRDKVDEDVPQPQRHVGDIIKFNRYGEKAKASL